MRLARITDLVQILAAVVAHCYKFWQRIL